MLRRVAGSEANLAGGTQGEIAARLNRARRHPAMAGLVALTLFLMLLFILSNLDLDNDRRVQPPIRQPFWRVVSSSTGRARPYDGTDIDIDSDDDSEQLQAEVSGDIPQANPIGGRKLPFRKRPLVPERQPVIDQESSDDNDNGDTRRPEQRLPVESESEPQPPVSSSSSPPSPPILPGRTRRRTLGAQYHRSNESSTPVCAAHYDFAYTSWWAQQAKPFCVVDSTSPSSSLVPAPSLTCRVTRHPKLPVPTGPHTVCDGHQLVVDFDRLSDAKCAKHRPGYFCDGSATYKSWAPGALSAACTKTSHFELNQFPADHLRDIFDSFQTAADGQTEIVTGVTVFVTRERGEHVNMYHSMTDFFNVFVVLEMLDIDPNDVQIVIIDDHDSGPLDGWWNQVYSLHNGMRRTRDFNMNSYGNRRYRFEHAIFSPPGYSSLFLADLQEPGACSTKSDLVASFADYVLVRYGITRPQVDNIIRVLFVSRRPYTTQVVHKFIGRQIDNEDALLSVLRSLPNVEVTVVDFAKKPLREQIEIVAAHDVFIAMHGAGMAHILWLPEYGGVLELRPNTNMGWLCFLHMGQWRGLDYKLWENTRHPQGYRQDKNGDYTTVDVGEFTAAATSLIDGVRARKYAKRTL